jgi:hypothetical protein
MTNKELVSEALATMLAIGECYEDQEDERELENAIRIELLRRLDEADALRKENEELRKDEERMDFLSNPDRRVSQSHYRNGVAYEVIGCFGECLRMVIDTEMRHDAAKAKESEASHDNN